MFGMDEQPVCVADLEFSLYARPLHPELFRIFAKRTIRLQDDGPEVVLWLVGGGHVAAVHHRGGSLTEAAGIPFDSRPAPCGLLNTIPFRGERTQEFQRVGGLKYCMSLQVEQLSPPHYRRVHDELLRCGPDALFHSFEDLTPDRPAPFSYIDYEFRRRELLIQAFHAFPDEYTIVKTQSVFEFTQR